MRGSSEQQELSLIAALDRLEIPVPNTTTYNHSIRTVDRVVNAMTQNPAMYDAFRIEWKRKIEQQWLHRHVGMDAANGCEGWFDQGIVVGINEADASVNVWCPAGVRTGNHKRQAMVKMRVRALQYDWRHIQYCVHGCGGTDGDGIPIVGKCARQLVTGVQTSIIRSRFI